MQRSFLSNTEVRAGGSGGETRMFISSAAFFSFFPPQSAHSVNVCDQSSLFRREHPLVVGPHTTLNGEEQNLQVPLLLKSVGKTQMWCLVFRVFFFNLYSVKTDVINLKRC